MRQPCVCDLPSVTDAVLQGNLIVAGVMLKLVLPLSLWPKRLETFRLEG